MDHLCAQIPSQAGLNLYNSLLEVFRSICSFTVLSLCQKECSIHFELNLNQRKPINPEVNKDWLLPWGDDQQAKTHILWALDAKILCLARLSKVIEHDNGYVGWKSLLECVWNSYTLLLMIGYAFFHRVSPQSFSKL